MMKNNRVLTQKQIKDLEAYGINTNIIKPDGQVVHGLIVISNGRKLLHDSGYPFISVFGVMKEGLVDLGWHDHYISYVPINVDSYGQNIFHITPWLNENQRKEWKISDTFISLSTFQIGNIFTFSQEDKDFIILR